MSTADVLLRFEPSLQERGISEDQFVHWATREEDGRDLVGVLLQVIVEVSHVKFGLRPLSTQDEAAIVRLGKCKVSLRCTQMANLLSNSLSCCSTFLALCTCIYMYIYI